MIWSQSIYLVVLAGAGAVVLAGMAPPIGDVGPDEGAGAGPDGGDRITPGMICAMARCCCNGTMLGQIANSSIAPILKTMPKEARDIFPNIENASYIKNCADR